MRPGGGNIKLVRIHFPTMTLIKRDGRDAGVAPEQPDRRAIDDGGLRTLQQPAAKSLPLIFFVRAHAAKLPGWLLLVGIQHEAGAGNQRRVFIRRTRIKNSDVPRGKFVIAGKLRGLFRQSRTKHPVAHLDDDIDGYAADRDLLRAVLGQNFSHNLKKIIASIIPATTIYFNDVVPGNQVNPRLTFDCS